MRIQGFASACALKDSETDDLKLETLKKMGDGEMATSFNTNSSCDIVSLFAENPIIKNVFLRSLENYAFILYLDML